MPAPKTITGDVYITIYTPVFPFEFNIGTRTALRDTKWFDGVVLSVSDPSEDFDQARVASGERITVRISSLPGTQLRASLQTTDFTFTALVEVETLVALPNGSTFTASNARRYRYVSDSIETDTIVLVMTSIDDSALDETYPSQLYQTADYPAITPAIAGQPIAFPVGTAVKVPCRLLALQTLWDGTLRQPEWLYGVCHLEWQSFAITAVNTGAKTFGVSGDRTALLNVGDSIWVFDPASRTVITNEGKFTVAAVSFGSGTTTITVNETIGSATVAASVNIPPRVLNLYRNGRLINKTEYTIEVMDNGAGAVPATVGDFSTGGTDWTATAGGTGTATLASGTATITGDGGATNFGSVFLQTGRGVGVQQRRGTYAPWRITCTGTGAAWLSDTTTAFPIAGNGSLVRAGSPARLLIRRGGGTNDLRCRLTTSNAGATGTSLTFDNWSIDQPAVPLLMVRFTREQRDPGGALYTIDADVLGYRSRNVADEIKRIIEGAGLAVETASFASAATYATDNRMLIDCDHGARGVRKRRAIIEDLLYIARGSIATDAFGEYTITQDREPTLSVGTFDESAGDLIEVDSSTRQGLVKTVEIVYRPSTVQPEELLHTIKRDVFGASGIGTERRECPYLRDHEAADRLLCYLQVRALKPRRVRGKLYLQRPVLGYEIAIRNPNIFNLLVGETFPGVLRSQRHTRLGIDFEAMELADVDTYTAGTLPGDINEAYEPDYSQTPPAAPTGLRITALTAGRATVDAIPPVENWQELWFVITHNTNGQIMGLILGDFSATTGRASTIIGGLTTGQVYKLQAYAKNTYLLQGLLQSTFDATAIGGGAAVTTFTA
jgi:hypothetical protein